MLLPLTIHDHTYRQVESGEIILSIYYGPLPYNKHKISAISFLISQEITNLLSNITSHFDVCQYSISTFDGIWCSSKVPVLGNPLISEQTGSEGAQVAAVSP